MKLFGFFPTKKVRHTKKKNQNAEYSSTAISRNDTVTQTFLATLIWTKLIFLLDNS